MTLIYVFKKFLHRFFHLVGNRLKRAQLAPLGFRAKPSTRIAWSVTADSGGSGGRIVVGDHTRLDIGVVLRAYSGYISIGDHCSINPYCVLYGKGGLKIGNGVRIASHSVIVAANHIFVDTGEFIFRQGDSAVGITIEDDVWVGAGAKILDGVTICRGTVVGAGAVVTRSTEAWSVVAGVPARKISSRLTEASQNIPAGS